jgi:hypothetical protein
LASGVPPYKKSEFRENCPFHEINREIKRETKKSFLWLEVRKKIDGFIKYLGWNYLVSLFHVLFHEMNILMRQHFFEKGKK